MKVIRTQAAGAKPEAAGVLATGNDRSKLCTHKPGSCWPFFCTEGLAER